MESGRPLPPCKASTRPLAAFRIRKISPQRHEGMKINLGKNFIDPFVFRVFVVKTGCVQWPIRASHVGARFTRMVRARSSEGLK